MAACTAVGAATLGPVPELPEEFAASFVVVVVIVVVVEPLELAGLLAPLAKLVEFVEFMELVEFVEFVAAVIFVELVEEAAELPEVRGTASAFGAGITPLSDASAELATRADAENAVTNAIALDAVPDKITNSRIAFFISLSAVPSLVSIQNLESRGGA